MKRKVTILIKTIGLIGLVFALLFLMGEKTSLQAAEPIRIGATLTITGWAGFLGTPEKEGVEIAVDQINRKGGVLGRPIEVYFEDDQSNPTTSAIAATKLIKDKKICALIGSSFTGGDMAQIPIAENEGVPTLFPCPVITPFKKWVFLPIIDDLGMSNTMLDFTVKTLGAKKIAILHGDEVGFMAGIKNIEDNVGKYGASVVIKEQFSTSDTSMIPQLTKIKAAKPDAIILYTVAPPASIVAKNYKQLGLKIPVVCSGGVPSKEFAQLVGNILTGEPWVMFGIKMGRADTMSPDDPWRKNHYDPFTKALREKYGKDKEVQLWHANGYDLFQMFMEAIKMAGKDDRAAIRDALEKLRFEGLLGGYFQVTPTDHNGCKGDFLEPLIVKGNTYWLYKK
jgi:branched-chain amino acid transport system substrate-binding protein